MSFHFRIDTSDLLIIVIDTKEHFSGIVSQGVEVFLKYHMTNDLDMSNPEQIVQSKQILVCLNKMDLLSSDQVDALQTCLDATKPSKNIQVSRISCVENQIRVANIEELLAKLKEKLGQL